MCMVISNCINTNSTLSAKVFEKIRKGGLNYVCN